MPTGLQAGPVPLHRARDQLHQRRRTVHDPTYGISLAVFGLVLTGFAPALAQADPLNATVVVPLSGDTAAMVVVELRNATHDAAAGTVTYQVTVLAAEEGDSTAEAATPLAALDTDLAFGPGHLFVDNVDVDGDTGSLGGSTGCVGPTGYVDPDDPPTGAGCGEPGQDREAVVPGDTVEGRQLHEGRRQSYRLLRNATGYRPILSPHQGLVT